jgi:hypothetical protein
MIGLLVRRSRAADAGLGCRGLVTQICSGDLGTCAVILPRSASMRSRSWMSITTGWKVQDSGLGATSINMTLTTLAAVLELAVEYQLIDRNPAKGRRRRLPAVKPRRIWLDRADRIGALLDATGEIDREARGGVCTATPFRCVVPAEGGRVSRRGDAVS